MHFVTRFAAAAIVIGAVAVNACSSDPARPNPGDPECVIPANGDFRDSTRGRVVIQGFAFNPAAIQVRKGMTVKWVFCDGPNTDSHSVTSDAGLWDSGLITYAIRTYSRAFAATGSFPYHCIPHPFMEGTVTVVD
jgi:plastocyanin